MSSVANRRVNLIVAACANNGIGIDGRLPWHLKRDMEFFKDLTMSTQDPAKQNAVIMGRKTFLSIPEKYRPLKDRVNIVLSTQMGDNSGLYVARSYLEALDLVAKEPLASTVESIFVIGGASVYKTAMENSKNCRVYYTNVQKEVACDTFFPKIDPEIFRKLNRDELPESVPNETFTENEISFTFEVYDRKAV